MSKGKKNKSKNKKIQDNKPKVNQNEVKFLNKYYNVAKVLLTLSPFVSLTYLSMSTAKLGLSLPQAIQQSLSFT